MQFKISILAATIFTFIAGNAAAHDYKLGTLEIAHPWARATPRGAAAAAGYLTITNKGTAPDRLVGGSAAFAGRVQIHDMKISDGVMRMRPLAQGLEIEPGGTVELKPGSSHIMFLDLRQPLQKNDRVKGTLVFEKAGSVEVEYAVEALGSTPGGAAPVTEHGH